VQLQRQLKRQAEQLPSPESLKKQWAFSNIMLANVGRDVTQHHQ
jgi:hypothetical protein